MSAREEIPFRWGHVTQSLTRPYPVTVPMVALVLLVPLYLFIPDLTPVRTFHAPALALDRIIPLVPAWAIVYGALYAFLILLPVLVVRDERQIRRTVYAYLTVWLVSYAFFVVYPTIAPRPAEVIGDGFFAWGLRSLYSSDPPYNCFPSIHVAHSFVSALTCHRVHRGVGVVSLACAAVVGLSTLYTKQHYVADVIAGIVLAFVAYAVFLRNCARDEGADRRLPVALALLTFALSALGIVFFWIVYRFTAGT